MGHNIRRVGYLEVMGDVVPHWRDVREFRPKTRVLFRYLKHYRETSPIPALLDPGHSLHQTGNLTAEGAEERGGG